MEQTVRKAFDVLEALAKSREPRRLTDLARELSLTKPNVYRLLSTLSELGYVAKEESTSRYSATLKLWEVGMNHVHDPDLVGKTAGRLKSLVESSRHPAQIAVYDQGYALFVNRLDLPHQPVKSMATIHSRVPAAVTSTGKAILAWKGENEIKHAMTLVKRFTPHTRMQRADLERDLDEARTRGFAVTQSEWREGVAGIAAPVRNERGEVIAALGVWGPESSLLGSQKEEFGSQVVAAAEGASRELGFRAR